MKINSLFSIRHFFYLSGVIGILFFVYIASWKFSFEDHRDPFSGNWYANNDVIAYIYEPIELYEYNVQRDNRFESLCQESQGVWKGDYRDPQISIKITIKDRMITFDKFPGMTSIEGHTFELTDQNRVDWVPSVSPLTDYDFCVRAGNNIIGLKLRTDDFGGKWGTWEAIDFFEGITGDGGGLGGVNRKLE